MNKQQLIELIRVNLLYVNPQMTNKAREKGKKGKSLSRYLMLQFVLSGLALLWIYSVTMFAVDFNRMPGFFTYYVALFSLLGLSQSISVIYNIFFEGTDLQAFLPLPFRQSQLFLSKILVVAMTIAPFVFPLLVLFLLTGWRAQHFFLVTIFFAFLLFALFLILLFCIASLLVFGLAQTSLFKKHKKAVTSPLLGGSMVIAVVGIMWMNHQTVDISVGLADRQPLVFLLPFYHVMNHPFSTNGLLNLGIILVTVLVLLFAIRSLIVPKLTDQLTASTTEVKAKCKHKKDQTLRQLLFNYNMQLVEEPSLILQVISSSLITPIIFIIAFAVGDGINLSTLDIRLIGVVFFTGIVLASLTVNQTSFVSNLISLDQENYLFIRSLPLSMKRYLKEKFRFGWLLQSCLSGGIAIIAGLIFRLPLLFLLSFLLGNLIGTYILSLRYFARDYRLLLLNWTNINQLFTRGAGNLGLVAMLMGTIIGSVIILVIYGITTLMFPFWIVNGIAFALLIPSVLWLIRYYQKNFWEKL